MSSQITLIKDYDQLYKKDKCDRTRIWKLRAIKKNLLGQFFIDVEYGIQDGKIIHTEKEIRCGKNIGKKNETSTEEQLIQTCDKMFKDKIEKELYVQDMSHISSIKSDLSYCPMLAATWTPNCTTKHKVSITFPCFVQPKLDGIRCLTYIKDDTVVNQSRQLKYFKNLEHINAEITILLKDHPGLVLDGELYNHDVDFNQIASAVKKEKLKEGDKERLICIKYYVYDMFVDGAKLGFNDRLLFLVKYIQNMKYVRLLDTFRCKNKDEVAEFHANFIQDKYEGTILRNIHAEYEFRRSKNLQKYKDFIDQEFVIIGYKEGSGTDAGTVIWRCNTEDGGDFDCRPMGSVAERRELFLKADSFIGKLLTVKFQNLSDYGIPRFPVGIRIRDYE